MREQTCTCLSRYNAATGNQSSTDVLDCRQLHCGFELFTLLACEISARLGTLRLEYLEQYDVDNRHG